MLMRFKKAPIALGICLSLSSCAVTDQLAANKETLIGCTLGTGLGAVLGKQLAGDEGAYIGAALGAAIGCSIGYDFQKRREQLEQLAKEEQLDVQFTAISTDKNDPSKMLITSTNQALSEQELKQYENYQTIGSAATISSASEQMFKVGSAKPTPEGERQLKKLATIFKDSDKNILITGHTDANGSEQANQILSEQRAQFVAQLFSQQGIAKDRLFFQGAGESQPIASNSSVSGQQQNRRVEVVEVEGTPDQLLNYANKQNTNISYLSRRSQDTVSEVADVKPTQADVTTTTKTANAKTTVSKTTAQAKPKASSQAPTQPETITVTAAEQAKIVPQAKTKKAKIEFGGKPMPSVVSDFALTIGQKPDSGFSLISKAYADEVISLNCASEGPRVSGNIKSLSTGQEYQRQNYDTGDYLPGMYGTTWLQKVNGHLVAMTPVAVLRDSGGAVASPQIMIWQNYKGKANSQPDYTLDTQIETYQGDKGLLYRIYAKSPTAPMRCMDIVMPVANSAKAIDGNIYYENKNKVYQASYTPSMLRTNKG
ncbi:OmpA family protein [Motilimonas sp. KMU-193]|uniref:OmpA family protein n=1 Tax=Motilimonas sp. KMU-193 TaxID=3388668 RepID=UPI00396B1694